MALPISPSLTLKDARRFQRAILSSFTPVEHELVEFLYDGGYVDSILGHAPGSATGLSVVLLESDGDEEEARGGQRVVDKLVKAGWLWFEPTGEEDEDGEIGRFWLTDAAHRFWQVTR